MGEIVICRACGKEFRRINYTHLEKYHGMTTEEYREKFPGAPLYIRDEEELRKYSATRLGRPTVLSQQAKQKLAERNRQMNKTKEHQEKMEKVYDSMRGKPKSEAHKQAMRRAKAREDKVYATERNLRNLYGSLDPSKVDRTSVYCGVFGIRDDLRFFLRSKMEANTARILNFRGIDFAYEPDTFSVEVDGRKKGYTPDFKVGDSYIEVKGYWTEKAMVKFSAFRDQYPHINIKVLDKKIYRRLERRYKNKIPNWE